VNDTAGGNANWCKALWKKISGLHKNLNIDLPYDPAIPPLGIYPKECNTGLLQRHLHIHVYCSSIHNSQVMEITKMPLLMNGSRKSSIYTQWNFTQP
jgi:CDP-diacylglycerol pyrophosphatase